MGIHINANLEPVFLCHGVQLKSRQTFFGSSPLSSLKSNQLNIMLLAIGSLLYNSNAITPPLGIAYETTDELKLNIFSQQHKNEMLTVKISLFT